MKKYAKNYFQTRFRFTMKNFTSPNLESCRSEHKDIFSEIYLNVTCKALLLQNLSETEFSLLKSIFVSQFPQFYSKSQIRYVVFHLVLNHIVRYSFQQGDIKSIGNYTLFKEGFNLYFFNPGNLHNWGDVLGPVLVSKLSDINALQGAKSQEAPVLYTVGSILQVREAVLLQIQCIKRAKPTFSRLSNFPFPGTLIVLVIG